MKGLGRLVLDALTYKILVTLVAITISDISME